MELHCWSNFKNYNTVQVKQYQEESILSFKKNNTEGDTTDGFRIGRDFPVHHYCKKGK